jgi:hypothetical protein
MHARAEDLLKLRELPQLEPPAGVFERVLAAEGARAAARRSRRRGLTAAAAAAFVAAGVVAALVRELPRAPAFVRAPAAAPAFATRAPPEPASYAPLVAESARLERLLAALPPRGVMAGSTAGTIAGLEDRIALVDAQLSYAAARDLAPTYREALWGERVELMNALLYVRFGQGQGF